MSETMVEIVAQSLVVLAFGVVAYHLDWGYEDGEVMLLIGEKDGIDYTNWSNNKMQGFRTVAYVKHNKGAEPDKIYGCGYWGSDTMGATYHLIARATDGAHWEEIMDTLALYYTGPEIYEDVGSSFDDYTVSYYYNHGACDMPDWGE